MKKFVLIGLFIISMFQNTVSNAEIGGDTSMDLYQDCLHVKNSGEPINKVFCLSYIKGFIEGVQNSQIMAEKLGAGSLICRPKETTTSQMALIFLKYMDNNPNKLHEIKGPNLYISLLEAFPCKTEN